MILLAFPFYRWVNWISDEVISVLTLCDFYGSITQKGFSSGTSTLVMTPVYQTKAASFQLMNTEAIVPDT